MFDGKPPGMKSGELLKRSEKRAEAEKGLVKATDQGNKFIVIIYACLTLYQVIKNKWRNFRNGW